MHSAALAYGLGVLMMLPLAIAIFWPHRQDDLDLTEVQRREKAMQALERIGGRVR